MVVLMHRALTTLMLVAALGGVRSGTGAAQQREVVEMVAERFTFTPSRLEVPVGTTVEIHIRSEDTDHGFHLVNGPNVIVPKRRQGEAVVVFEAEAPGVYQFECSKLCGAGHNFMKGEIIVTGPNDNDDGAGAGNDDS
jgi:heme/copper-type cytochrome/quinol oxidase subunit 2